MSAASEPRLRGTLLGLAAVAMWAGLAPLTVLTAPMPPFLLTAASFALGGVAGLFWFALLSVLQNRLRREERARRLARPSGRALMFITAGLAGYHLLYFGALRLAPPAEANLIAYFWPLLIVLGSGAVTGERLRRRHLFGVALAACGAALVFAGRIESGSEPEFGHLLALAAAVVWAVYSLGTRQLLHTPPSAVPLACLCTALFAFAAHLALETPALPEGCLAWGALVALGLGPVGLAFVAWDLGMRWGDIRLIATAAYAAPVLSTLALVALGLAEATQTLLLAAAMIAAGAALARGSADAVSDPKKAA